MKKNKKLVIAIIVVASAAMILTSLIPFLAIFFS